MSQLKQRDKPSSKARIVSYNHIRSLFLLLKRLKVFAAEEAGINPSVKPFVMKHTPPDKRGGPDTIR